MRAFNSPRFQKFLNHQQIPKLPFLIDPNIPKNVKLAYSFPYLYEFMETKLCQNSLCMKFSTKYLRHFNQAFTKFLHFQYLCYQIKLFLQKNGENGEQQLKYVIDTLQDPKLKSTKFQFALTKIVNHKYRYWLKRFDVYMPQKFLGLGPQIYDIMNYYWQRKYDGKLLLEKVMIKNKKINELQKKQQLNMIQKQYYHKFYQKYASFDENRMDFYYKAAVKKGQYTLIFKPKNYIDYKKRCQQHKKQQLKKQKKQKNQQQQQRKRNRYKYFSLNQRQLDNKEKIKQNQIQFDLDEDNTQKMSFKLVLQQQKQQNILQKKIKIQSNKVKILKQIKTLGYDATKFSQKRFLRTNILKNHIQMRRSYLINKQIKNMYLKDIDMRSIQLQFYELKKKTQYRNIYIYRMIWRQIIVNRYKSLYIHCQYCIEKFLPIHFCMHIQKCFKQKFIALYKYKACWICHKKIWTSLNKYSQHMSQHHPLWVKCKQYYLFNKQYYTIATYNQQKQSLQVFNYKSKYYFNIRRYYKKLNLDYGFIIRVKYGKSANIMFFQKNKRIQLQQIHLQYPLFNISLIKDHQFMQLKLYNIQEVIQQQRQIHEHQKNINEKKKQQMLQYQNIYGTYFVVFYFDPDKPTSTTQLFIYRFYHRQIKNIPREINKWFYQIQHKQQHFNIGYLAFSLTKQIKPKLYMKRHFNLNDRYINWFMQMVQQKRKCDLMKFIAVQNYFKIAGLNQINYNNHIKINQKVIQQYDFLDILYINLSTYASYMTVKSEIHHIIQYLMNIQYLFFDLHNLTNIINSIIRYAFHKTFSKQKLIDSIKQSVHQRHFNYKIYCIYNIQCIKLLESFSDEQIDKKLTQQQLKRIQFMKKQQKNKQVNANYLKIFQVIKQEISKHSFQKTNFDFKNIKIKYQSKLAPEKQINKEINDKATNQK